MAIIGGAGNPVGGSFTGPAQALEIYGDFAQPLQVIKSASTTPAEVLKFTTGNYIAVVTLQINMGCGEW